MKQICYTLYDDDVRSSAFVLVADVGVDGNTRVVSENAIIR